MRNVVLAFALAASVLSAFLPANAQGGCNPAIDRLGLADPFVLLHDGVYYMYPTVDGVEGYQVWTSTDARTWTEGPVVYSAGPNAWAPELYYDDDSETFFLYYSVNLNLGVATSDSPLGPFVDQGLLVNDAIDAHLFEDDDGSLYLYYEEIFFTGPVPTTSRMWVQPMSTPSTPMGPRISVFGPTEPWEGIGVVPITEGPFMLKHDGTFYLMYSGNLTPTPNYAIGYATSDSPTGPFTKYGSNPIASKAEGVLGPGHHSLFVEPNGRIMVAYHQKLTSDFGFDRYIAVDPLIIRPDGTLDIEPQPLSLGSSAECEAPYNKRGKKAKLKVTSKGGSADTLKIVVTKIDGLAATDLGDPTTTTEYSVYVQSLGATSLVPSSQFELKGAPGKEALEYADKQGVLGGITLIKLKTSAVGKGKLIDKAKGENLGLVPPLEFAELQAVAVCNLLGVCVVSTLDETLKSTDTQFRARQSALVQ